MVLIEWNDSLSVNVDVIDQQHQKLIGLINKLNDAMSEGKGKEILGSIINDLLNYTVTHFKAEEDYFEQFGYPAADSHKKEHNAFIQKISEFKDGFEKGAITLSLKVMEFLSGWLQSHIKGTDKKYVQLFKENGLK